MPGGGAGSIQAVITSLRENKKLLRKKTHFLREQVHELSRAEHKESLQFKEASDELLTAIKRKHRSRKRRIDLLAFVVVVLSAIAVLFFVQENHKAANGTIAHQRALQKITASQEDIEKQRMYILHVNAGDTWYSQSHFANAAYHYNRALELYPNNRAVEERLKNTYSLACTRYGLLCEEYEAILKIK